MITIRHVGIHMSCYLIHYLRIATKYTRAHPGRALGIVGGATVGGAVAGVFDASGALWGIAIIWGTLKAGYSATAIALVIAAVRGTVEIITHVRQAGGTVATGANATSQAIATAARRLTALWRDLANAAGRPTSQAWPGARPKEYTPGLRPVS